MAFGSAGLRVPVGGATVEVDVLGLDTVGEAVEDVDTECVVDVVDSKVVEEVLEVEATDVDVV